VDILKAVLITDIPTRIQQLANIQFIHFNLKLAKLEKLGFVTVFGGKHRTILITQRGADWVNEISEALELVTHEHE